MGGLLWSQVLCSKGDGVYIAMYTEVLKRHQKAGYRHTNSTMHVLHTYQQNDHNTVAEGKESQIKALSKLETKHTKITVVVSREERDRGPWTASLTFSNVTCFHSKWLHQVERKRALHWQVFKSDIVKSDENIWKGVSLFGVGRLPKRVFIACITEACPFGPLYRARGWQDSGTGVWLMKQDNCLYDICVHVCLVRKESLLTEMSPHLLENFLYGTMGKRGLNWSLHQTNLQILPWHELIQGVLPPLITHWIRWASVKKYAYNDLGKNK